MKYRTPIVMLFFLAGHSHAELPEGYWGSEKSQPILDATLRITLDPDLTHLGESQTEALKELLAAGAILHGLYEQQLHAGAADAKIALDELHASGTATADTANLLDLYYLSKGPVATTLDNDRRPFLPVAPSSPGKNIYPAGISRDEINAYMEAHSDEASSLLDVRSVVRRATEANLDTDIAQLDRFPEVDALHDGLRQSLESREPDPGALYTIPYALAYAAELHRTRGHLNAAAGLLERSSPDFAAYLRNRGRDLLTGDYESGDASWVTGSFAALNAQIGSYETYNDSLLGVKAFYSASILIRDEEKSRDLAAAMSELQAIEDSLPYENPRRVQARIPVGVYNVIADFGQARGANTASILPNDADHARKYGRIVLIRNNLLTNQGVFENRKQRYDAVVDPEFRAHLTLKGGFDRTLWHEIGHYLGVSVTADGRNLDEALADHSNLLEEMKSDLVSLFAAPALQRAGYHDADSLRAHYADGIRRCLQVVRPRADQPYQNMQLMQFNYFVEHGLIEPRGESSMLAIDYDRYHEVVGELLREVLHLQYAGDYELADAFVQRWNYWDDALHGKLAARMRQNATYRSTMVRYTAIH